MTDLAPGAMLGKYRLERPLGRGGMGEVWAAHDPDLDRRVALKVLHAHVSRAEDARARFQREGRAMARLRHPNVIAVHDATFSDGRGVIAMELVEGENLASWATRKHPAHEIVRVLLAAGRGLVAAHAAGMIHRDFKPHNVLIDRDGRVLVTDFGLARTTGDDEEVTVTPAKVPRTIELDATATPARTPREIELDATATPQTDTVMTGARSRSSGRPETDKLSEPLTQTGALLGTPAYMAPEQLEGRPADARADQFAFCVSAWELLAGERPFRGGSVAEIAAAIDHGERRGEARLPRSLRSIIGRGLARDPLGRWSSMERLLETIERAWKRPRRIALAVGVLAAVGIVAAVFVATRPAPPPLEGCDLATDELAGVWSPSIRGDLERVLAGKSYQGRTLRFFDRWATSWETTRKQNCAKPADADFAPRRACLASIRDELGLMMSRASTFPAEMWSASDLVRAIPMPEGCAADPRGLAPKPPEPGARDEVAKIRIELATARAKMLTRSLEVLSIDVTPQLERARQTGYAPVIVEAEIMDGIARTIRNREDVPSCEAWGEIAAKADATGYDRMVTEALLIQHECLMALGGRADDAAQVLDRLDTITVRTQNPLHLAQVGGLIAARDKYEGRFEAALARIRKTREIYATLELDDWKATAAATEARILHARNLGDDLDRAIALVREVHEHHTHARQRQSAAQLWRQIAWRRGKIAEAPELELDSPDLSSPVVIDLTVRDARGPVAGARIATGPYLYADATREAMPERTEAIAEITDAEGTARLVIPKQSTILVRAPGGIAIARTPARNGPLVVELAPVATVSGSAPIAQRTTDPKTLVERAARRSIGYVFLVGTAHPITWMAPIDSAGRWQLPAIAPGRYRMLVQAESGLDDQARQRVIDIAPGASTVPELALQPAPRVLDVTFRPGPLGYALVLGASTVPKTWPELVAAAEASEHLAAAILVPASRRRGGEPGDMRAELSVPPGPSVLCTFVLESFSTAYPLTRLVPDADTAPPRCHPLTGEESQLVIKN